MNKNTSVFRVASASVKTLVRRALGLLRGGRQGEKPGPQWQQLELPFTRTPVRRWNR